MNTKTLLIGLVVVALLGAGAYYLLMNPQAAQNPTENPSTETGDVVEAQDVTVGTGTQALPGNLVSVLYVGMLPDGTVFDSSAANGNQPLVFELGTPNIIAGFQIGVNQMRVGGERRIAIPPSLGYGAEAKTDAAGKVLIPANSTLIFDIKLLDVQEGTSTPSAQ